MTGALAKMESSLKGSTGQRSLSFEDWGSRDGGQEWLFMDQANGKPSHNLKNLLIRHERELILKIDRGLEDDNECIYES